MVQKTGTKSRRGRADESDMPALPRNVYRTPNGFVFRVVVPTSLRSFVGKREIKKSLGADRGSALSEAKVLALQVDRDFAAARAQFEKVRLDQASVDGFLGQLPEKRSRVITKLTPELTQGLRSLWLATLDADLSWRREGIDDDEYDELDANIADMKRRIARALATGQAQAFIPVVRFLATGRGYEFALSEDAERQLVLDLLPAIQHGYDVLEQRQAGRLVEPEPQAVLPLPAAWEPEPIQPAGFDWEKLYQHWQQDRSRPRTTEIAAEAALKSLVAAIPKTTTPLTLTRAQVTEWLRKLRDERKNSNKTLEKNGTLVGAMFSVAMKDDLLEKNPFLGFDYNRFASKVGVEKPLARAPFSDEQLRRVFSEDEGVYGVTGSGGGGYFPRVWFPLLGFLTGARLNEVGNLTVDDVLAEPIWHICIRSGKTASSVRQVPLHPELLRLGFIDYVRAVRKAGHTTLWPTLRSKSEKTNNSEVFGRWFNRYLHSTLKLPANVVFHSFRHTFKDLCRNALIPRDLHHALTGHAKSDGGNVGDEYGSGFSLEVKHEQLSKIEVGFKLARPRPFGTAEGKK